MTIENYFFPLFFEKLFTFSSFFPQSHRFLLPVHRSITVHFPVALTVMVLMALMQQRMRNNYFDIRQTAVTFNLRNPAAGNINNSIINDIPEYHPFLSLCVSLPVALRESESSVWTIHGRVFFGGWDWSIFSEFFNVKFLMLIVYRYIGVNRTIAQFLCRRKICIKIWIGML